uniref:Uncharacterized protein n=2 Tax=Timema TaxID=61471 RepID=A0A7R9APA9_TIMSH|nr:unnamed protein product [Timema shepardi]CAD7570163.1 unnamed protein product [Timema californicum]
MIQILSENNKQNGYLKKSPIKLLTNIFRRKKHNVGKDNIKTREIYIEEMEQESKHSNVQNLNYGAVPRVPSTLSVTAVNIVVQTSCCPPSPALSTLTLTPGRTRDIDQDMQALRLSRQDNPFLQVLASRESLVDSLEESESDDANLMSQEFPIDLDVDPLTLPEIHEHMIRSPPPTTWPKSPNFKVFRFPMQQSDDESSQDGSQRCSDKKSPLKMISPRHSRASLSDCVRELSAEVLSSVPVIMSPRLGNSPRPHSRSVNDSNRSSNPFLLLNPEVRRVHARNSDDNVHLVSQVEDGPSADL